MEGMLDRIELVRKANLCLHAVEPSGLPDLHDQQACERLDQRLRERLSVEELNKFTDCMNSNPPRVQLFGSKFFAMERKVNRHFNYRYKCISIMLDDSGEIHTIWGDGQLLWTTVPEE